jgi:hypothetical protein
MLNQQLITVEDEPPLLAFLNTRVGDEERGWAAWEKYWASVDFPARLEQLKGIAPYVVV